MKIDTDLVKNKRFKLPIKPSLLNKSQEYRALATLRYLYPTKYDTMIAGDAPDLQDQVNDTGIEVTVAVKPNNMKAVRAFSDLHQSNANERQNREKIKSTGYSFVPLPNGTFAISTTGTSDGEKYYFQKSIKDKLKKLQEYRTKCKNIGLAIILPETPTSDAENNFSEWAFEVTEEGDNTFDFIYVISHRFCLYCNIHSNTSEKLSLTSAESEWLSAIGRMTAEDELSITDIEWQ